MRHIFLKQDYHCPVYLVIITFATKKLQYFVHILSNWNNIHMEESYKYKENIRDFWHHIVQDITIIYKYANIYIYVTYIYIYIYLEG